MRFLFSCLVIVFLATNTFAQEKPLVNILATGATIAGVGASETSSDYTSGVVSVDKIIQSAPEILQFAQIKGDQVVNIPSQNITEVDDALKTLTTAFDSLFVTTAIDNGAEGIVYAGVGNGNPNTSNMNALANAVKQGIPVVRSTRTPFGPTTQRDEADDDCTDSLHRGIKLLKNQESC